MAWGRRRAEGAASGQGRQALPRVLRPARPIRRHEPTRRPRYVSLSLCLSLSLSLSFSLSFSLCVFGYLAASLRFSVLPNLQLLSRCAYLPVHPSIRPSVRPSIHSSFCSSCLALSLSMCMWPRDCSADRLTAQGLHEGLYRRKDHGRGPAAHDCGVLRDDPQPEPLHGGGGHRPLRRGLHNQHVQRASRGASGTQNDRAFLQSITSFIHPPIHPSIRVSIHPSIHPLCFILAVINHTHPALSAPPLFCVREFINELIFMAALRLVGASVG